jgi:hypothetical protein
MGRLLPAEVIHRIGIRIEFAENVTAIAEAVELSKNLVTSCISTKAHVAILLLVTAARLLISIGPLNDTRSLKNVVWPFPVS